MSTMSGMDDGESMNMAMYMTVTLTNDCYFLSTT